MPNTPAKSKAELGLVKLPNQELMEIGVYKGGKENITLDTFRELITNFKKGLIKVPVKLGHDDNQEFANMSGLPACGWIENLYLSGRKLVADLVDVPQRVGRMIERNAYRQKSVEIVHDYHYNNQSIGTVLTGLALLGAEIPEIKTLNDLNDFEALYYNEKINGGVRVSIKTKVRKDKKNFADGDSGSGSVNPIDAIRNVVQGIIESLDSGEVKPETLLENLNGVIAACDQAEKVAEQNKDSKDSNDENPPDEPGDMKDAKKKEDVTMTEEMKKQFAEMQSKITALETKSSALETKNTELERRNLEDKMDFRKKETVAYVDGLVKEGKLTPAEVGKTVALLMNLPEDKKLKFTADSKEHEVGTFEAMKELLSNRPSSIDFKEKTGDKVKLEDEIIQDKTNAAIEDCMKASPSIFGTKKGE